MNFTYTNGFHIPSLEEGQLFLPCQSNQLGCSMRLLKVITVFAVVALAGTKFSFSWMINVTLNDSSPNGALLICKGNMPRTESAGITTEEGISKCTFSVASVFSGNTETLYSLSLPTWLPMMWTGISNVDDSISNGVMPKE